MVQVVCCTRKTFPIARSIYVYIPPAYKFPAVLTQKLRALVSIHIYWILAVDGPLRIYTSALCDTQLHLATPSPPTIYYLLSLSRRPPVGDENFTLVKQGYSQLAETPFQQQLRNGLDSLLPKEQRVLSHSLFPLPILSLCS